MAVTEAQVVDAVRDAHDRHASLRIVGGGSWLHGGWPVRDGEVLDISGLRGITEYVPGDLTLTARAGTPLSEIADATRAHGQWLSLDPFGSPDGSLGATLATASAGPLAASIGLPRDVAVGVSFVAGDGQLVHGGGRVVKNVAGFDLVRLAIGAWGTLGVITSATVRLRARPVADETVALALPDESAALASMLAAFRALPVDPIAAELLSAGIAGRLGLGVEGGALLVRLAGNPVAVAHQRQALSRLAPVVAADPDAWQALRTGDPSGAIARLSRRPSELARLWGVATSIAGTECHATVARGIVRVRWTAPPAPASLDALDGADVRIVEQQAPAPHRLPVPTPLPDELHRRTRLAFDPAHILNAGILGEVPA